MLSDAPPSRDDVTTSRTCREPVEVKTFTSSGMTAPAIVPQLMIRESFHQSVPSPSVGISTRETTNVRITETIDVSHTSEVSGCSKFIRSALAYLPRANASLVQYDATLAITIMIRIAKIQTSSCTCTASLPTASRMNEISATPVTP